MAKSKNSQPDPGASGLEFYSDEDLANELIRRFDVAAFVAVKVMSRDRDRFVRVLRGKPLETIGLIRVLYEQAQGAYLAGIVSPPGGIEP